MKILIVEDEPKTGEYLRQGLNEAGFVADLAVNGSDGLMKKIIASMAYGEEVKSGTVAEIRRSFDRRATIDYQKSVTAEDLEITKEGNETVVTAAWQQKIPLFTGYTLIVDFSASTTDK